MDLYYTEKEKVKFLRKRGFIVKKTVVEMSYSAYHDDVEYEKVGLWGVFNSSGKAMFKPEGMNFEKEDWIDNAFEEAFKTALLQVVSSFQVPP